MNSRGVRLNLIFFFFVYKNFPTEGGRGNLNKATCFMCCVLTVCKVPFDLYTEIKKAGGRFGVRLHKCASTAVGGYYVI